MSQRPFRFRFEWKSRPIAYKKQEPWYKEDITINDELLIDKSKMNAREIR